MVDMGNTTVHPLAHLGVASLPVEPVDVQTIATWLASAWAGLDGDAARDVIREDAPGLGSDDCPHLSLVERTYTPDQERAYGAWGCEREVHWEMRGRRGEPVDVADLCRRTAEFCVAFARRNGRIALALRGPRAARSTWRAFAIN